MRKPGLDVLKILAVVAVVGLHTLSANYFSLSGRQEADRIFLVIADQLFRFCVPLFVAVSGYGLVVGYAKSLNIVHFLARRCQKLIPWYLVAATLTIFLITFVWHEDTALYHGASLWRLYFFGQADYHLYFVPMIIQLYLLFPIFLFLFKKFPGKLLVFLFLIWQIWWYWLIGQKTELVTNNNSLWPDQEQYRNFAAWIFYFILGMFLAMKKKEISSNKYLITGLVLIVAGLGLAVTNSLDLVTRGIDLIVATRFTRLPVLVLATGTIFLGKFLIDKLVVSSKKELILARLAGWSYLVYLFHPLVLRMIVKLLR